MTEKLYLMTEAQLALFKKVVGAAEGFHFITDRAMIIEADQMLQSLPMVDSEPVKFTDDDHADIFSGMMLISTAKSPTEFSQYLKQFTKSLKTVMEKVNAPQALTEISAEKA